MSQCSKNQLENEYQFEVNFADMQKYVKSLLKVETLCEILYADTFCRYSKNWDFFRFIFEKKRWKLLPKHQVKNCDSVLLLL